MTKLTPELLKSLPAQDRRELLELLERQRALRAKKDFLFFCEEYQPAHEKPAAHHRLLCSELQKVADGITPKLMVLMPPGSAKTTYSSYLFPAWLMARGDTKVIAAAHTVDRARYVSRKVQRVVEASHDLLGFGLASDAVDQWRDTTGGEYLAAGVGKGIAGFRADLGIIDDPVATMQAADSPVDQETNWNWYWGDFYTRLRPEARQVLVMTRWSEGDLGGRLEEAQGNEWRIIRLPAFAEAGDELGRAPGEVLWSDDSYGFGALLRKAHRELTAAGQTRKWSAQYQQRPAPETGDFFRKEWLRTAEPPPSHAMRIFGASDYAVTSNGGDYTVHVVAGIDADDRIYLLDMWRGQAASDVWVEEFCNLVVRWKPIGWAEETGQIKAALGPYLDRRCRERRAFVARTTFPTRGDKGIRAQSIRGRMSSLGLYLPPDAPWRADFEAEMMSFPAGKHDDQVDALGLIGQLLDKMIAPGKPEPDKAPMDSWARAFAQQDNDGSDWRTA